MDEPDQPEAASTPSDVASSRFQFSLWQIMVLTLLVSLIAAWLRLIPYREEYLWLYLTYFGLLAAYIVLRIPRITSELLKARRELDRHKAETLRDAEEARRRKRQGEPKPPQV